VGLPTATFSSFPAPDCWTCATTPAFSSQLLQRDFPSPLLQCSGHPALFATWLFCCYCLLFSFFSFFPGWGSVWPGGYADLAQGCMWEYRVPPSSPCGLRFPKPFGCCCLAVVWKPSWFLCLMWSGDAMCRLSKFCLFSVVFPVRCISIVSPRFYFRWHAFCFFPLAAILESPSCFFSWCLPIWLQREGFLDEFRFAFP
jgi:hypothetical protein